eukprot:465265-Rhodomonas_salina.1
MQSALRGVCPFAEDPPQRVTFSRSCETFVRQLHPAHPPRSAVPKQECLALQHSFSRVEPVLMLRTFPLSLPVGAPLADIPAS